MADLDVGRNLARAVAIVRDAYREISALFGALDDILERHGLRHLGDDWLGGSQSGAKLGQPENWIQESLHRGYMPTSKGSASSDRVLIFDIHLYSDKLAVPVVAVLALHLSRPRSPADFWNEWNWEPTFGWKIPILEKAPANQLPSGVHSLQGAAFGKTFPDVTEGKVFFIPLCEVTSDKFEEMLVTPALKLLRL